MAWTIRNGGYLFGGAVAAIVVANIAISTSASLQNYLLTKEAVEVADISDASYRAILPMSLERSVTQVGLSLATPAPFRISRPSRPAARLVRQGFGGDADAAERRSITVERG